jgi:glutamate-1-semialdehyde 2,1-aminomutase
MYAHHKLDHGFDHSAPPSLSYAVCATPRSGSSLLCELLCNTGLAGAPTEFFDRETYDAFCKAWGVTGPEGYLEELLRRKTGPNGVFGFKIHWDQYLEFFPNTDLRRVFPGLRMVLMRREDRLGQALSFSRAAQTGQWASHHPAKNPRPVFDRSEISRFLQKIDAEERAWEDLFRAGGIAPARVVYEHLVARPQPVVVSVLRALGIQADDDLLVPPPTLRRQADRLSRRWRRRYQRGDARTPGSHWKSRLRALLGRAFSMPSPACVSTRARQARWIEHNLPHRLTSRAIHGARITIENAGNFPWRSRGAGDPHVALTVHLDGTWIETHQLQRRETAPGARLAIHFGLAAPATPGPHVFTFDLVEWGIAHFRDQGSEPLVWPLSVESAEPAASEECLALAERVNPWHFIPTRGVLRASDGGLFPLFLSRAKGCRLWDLEGKEYVDYTMGHGTALLGHGDERVLRAVQEVMAETGPTVDLTHPLELEVSRMLTEDFPCAEMAVFGKHGSDACTLVARLARAFTRKKHILYRGYHGWQDFWAEQPGFTLDGAIPPRPEPLIHVFRYNDHGDFLRLFDRWKHDLAAVMIEPSPFGGDQVGYEPDDPGFLAAIGEAARSVGALLVFDETITGFRHPAGSAQKGLGVEPDLACVGKAIANGMPLSAAVGRADILRSSFPKIYYQATYRSEIYSLAAAKAAIGIYRREPVARHVWDYGTQLKRAIDELCRGMGIAGRCVGPPFRMAFVFGEADPERFSRMRTLFVQELLKQGIFTHHGIMLPSYAHDAAAMQTTLAGMQRALGVVAEGIRRDDLERRIEIPPVSFY